MRHGDVAHAMLALAAVAFGSATGGASSATINPNEPFPLVPDNGAMLSAIELYDPATGTITNLGDRQGSKPVWYIGRF